jgi:NADH dehydrogenase
MPQSLATSLQQRRRRIESVILVTGGTGFIGARVVHALRERDCDVRALVRKPGERSAATLAAWGVDLAQGDMTDVESLRRAVDGCEVVVHLVAIRQGREEQFQRVVEQGTRDLVIAAQAAGVKRFVLMSALGTSEETKDLVPYYHAKWEQEEIVRGSGLEHVIFRPSFVFASDGGILPTFRRLARVSPVTPIIGSGRQRIQPIWIEDVAAYFAQGVDHAEAANRTFELGGPDVASWNEFWERLKRVLGLRRPSVHVPTSLMRVNALLTERLPGNIPLTRDLLTMLEHGDNVASNDDAVRTFELPLVPLDEQLRRAA